MSRKYKKPMYSINEALTQEDPKIHSGYTQRYLKTNEFFLDNRYSINEAFTQEDWFMKTVFVSCVNTVYI
jgi:hypothetical protein